MKKLLFYMLFLNLYVSLSASERCNAQVSQYTERQAFYVFVAKIMQEKPLTHKELGVLERQIKEFSQMPMSPVQYELLEKALKRYIILKNKLRPL